MTKFLAYFLANDGSFSLLEDAAGSLSEQFVS